MKNKKVKITEYWRKKPRYVYMHKTKFEIFKMKVKTFFRRLLRGIIIALVLFLIYEAGSYLNPVKVYTKQEIIKEVDSFPPVLKRIAKAESYDSQFCTKEIVLKKGCHSYEVGSVLIHINKNGTYDIGRYAINSIHLLEAKNLGYDVYQEKDNEQFAIYMLKNQGSEPWNSSSRNW